ncbi:DUF1028 domain-containing protein [Deinococcus peraridilitoris]|uniref:Putative peptidoglycan binding domain-containing protein n=1 Tax=Deinococcus peraridilitoris (strain DSM 19664 / LMG 22246 / CIP 109416 / KR-200) TaxID=937777 RepID=L0A6H5_DEIPD|nr:DUF1028 domain-containing protein [Deinococcus peraridilitoris]AFZ69049.1 hypothetical protein Deipe_3621 [Deinococcus peraridilitoris DSM 19664]
MHQNLPARPVSTFSIVARDEQSGDFGVAVASKFLAVGAVVPSARAGIGAVATQSYANLRFGPQGLALLAQGASPQAVLEAFRRTDSQLASRQFGLVAASGEALSFTGEDCHPWAGGLQEHNVAVQGNLLAGPEVVQQMLNAYQQGWAQPFAHRLLAALQAGDRAGGDRRGRQSAALLVVGEAKGYGGMSDVWIDLRADDHPAPTEELSRLLHIHELLFSRPVETRPLGPDEIKWLQALLKRVGFRDDSASGAWDERTEAGLRALYGAENLEERWVAGGLVDPVAWNYFRSRFDAPDTDTGRSPL